MEMDPCELWLQCQRKLTPSRMTQLNSPIVPLPDPQFIYSKTPHSNPSSNCDRGPPQLQSYRKDGGHFTKYEFCRCFNPPQPTRKWPLRPETPPKGHGEENKSDDISLTKLAELQLDSNAHLVKEKVRLSLEDKKDVDPQMNASTAKKNQRKSVQSPDGNADSTKCRCHDQMMEIIKESQVLKLQNELKEVRASLRNTKEINKQQKMRIDHLTKLTELYPIQVEKSNIQSEASDKALRLQLDKTKYMKVQTEQKCRYWMAKNVEKDRRIQALNAEIITLRHEIDDALVNRIAGLEARCADMEKKEEEWKEEKRKMKQTTSAQIVTNAFLKTKLKKAATSTPSKKEVNRTPSNSPGPPSMKGHKRTYT